MTPTKISVDILILGGGLIGSAMALAMARHGFSVVLADPVPADVQIAPDFDGRAYAVAQGSVALLDALGLWSQLEDNAQALSGISVADRCGDPMPPAVLHFDPAELDRAALGRIVEDRWLRTALIAAIEAEPAIRRLTATLAPSAIKRTSTGVTASLSDGGTIQTALVIATDGRRSAIARDSGVRYLAWGYEQTGFVSAIEHDRPHDGIAHQGFFAGGPFAVLPLCGNRSSLVWSERAPRAQQVAALSDETYLTEVKARLDGRLGEVALAGRRWAYPLGLSLAMEYVRPRLAVAGDAAHGVHPIAGQGMNMGLRDVAALTEVLVDAARRGEDIGVTVTLQRYQQWRRFDAAAMALGMDALTRLFSTPAGPSQVLRNIGMGAVSRLAGARRFFMSEASGTSGNVPRLLTGQAL